MCEALSVNPTLHHSGYTHFTAHLLEITKGITASGTCLQAGKFFKFLFKHLSNFPKTLWTFWLEISSSDH